MVADALSRNITQELNAINNDIEIDPTIVIDKFLESQHNPPLETDDIEELAENLNIQIREDSESIMTVRTFPT